MTALVTALALTVLVLLALSVAARRARRSQRLVEERLAESRHEVGRLAEQVDRLAAEVSAARQPPPEDHEYVITTLVGAHQASAGAVGETGRSGWARERPRPGEMIEREAVARLAQVDTSTRLGARAADLGVRLVALGHGVRRALAQENRDRASAAAHVARRRSRRTRREELRQARRLVRAVRARQHLESVGQSVEHTEDVA